MSTTTTRQEATAARKDQIVRAAIAVLADGGYQATTFDAICRVAGLSSKRLITYHFTSKDDLMAAVAELVVAEAEEHLRPALQAATGPGELLPALIRANTAFVAGHLEQIRALEQIMLNGGKAWEGHHDDSVRRLTRLISDGQRTGAFRAGDPHLIATALRACLDSLYEPLAAGRDPQDCAQTLIDLFDHGLRP